MAVFQSELPAGSQIIEVKEDTSLTAGTTIHTVMVGDQATQAAKQKGWYFVTVTWWQRTYCFVDIWTR